MNRGINLLPWREEQRRTRDRRMLAAGLGIWCVCIALVIAFFTYLQTLQDDQSARNDYLTVETRKLDREIKNIEQLKERKNDLIARMEVIQSLQHERTQIVHLFDDLVRKLPDGIYLSSLQKRNKRVLIKGTAQSNARVSELMNRLDSSEWFDSPNLNVINITPSENVRLSKFQLSISESSNNSVQQEEL